MQCRMHPKGFLPISRPARLLLRPQSHSFFPVVTLTSNCFHTPFLPSFVRSEKGKREVRKWALLRGGALADDVASFVPPQESCWRNPILTARLPLPSAFRLLLRPFSLKELLSSASVSASHSRAISFSFGSWFCRNVELAALPPSLPPSLPRRRRDSWKKRAAGTAFVTDRGNAGEGGARVVRLHLCSSISNVLPFPHSVRAYF